MHRMHNHLQTAKFGKYLVISCVGMPTWAVVYSVLAAVDLC